MERGSRSSTWSSSITTTTNLLARCRRCRRWGTTGSSWAPVVVPHTSGHAAWVERVDNRLNGRANKRSKHHLARLQLLVSSDHPKHARAAGWELLLWLWKPWHRHPRQMIHKAAAAAGPSALSQAAAGAGLSEGLSMSCCEASVPHHLSLSAAWDNRR